MILLMEEILHHLTGSSAHYSKSFFTSQLVQDFFHQQYVWMLSLYNTPENQHSKTHIGTYVCAIRGLYGTEVDARIQQIMYLGNRI